MNSLEIGFAYGISTLIITEDVSNNGGHHIVMDKFKISDWGATNLDLLKQSEYINHLTFYEEYCYNVLPDLIKQKRK